MKQTVNMETVKELDGFELFKGSCPYCKAEFITSVNGILSCKSCGGDFIMDCV